MMAITTVHPPRMTYTNSRGTQRPDKYIISCRNQQLVTWAATFGACATRVDAVVRLARLSVAEPNAADDPSSSAITVIPIAFFKKFSFSYVKTLANTPKYRERLEQPDRKARELATGDCDSHNQQDRSTDELQRSPCPA